MTQLDVLQSGRICTLRVKGPLLLGESQERFDAAVQDALRTDHPFLILNLQAMPVIDSSGMGSIVNALVQAKKVGGEAMLVNPSTFAAKTFKMVHIHTLFRTFATEEEAVAACD